MRNKSTVIFLILFCLIKLSFEISCKDDSGKNVDWFVLYKLPKISDEPSGSSLSDGIAYAYITGPNPEKWKLSSKNITSVTSMLGKTWQEFKKIEKSGTYLFYNDDSPENFKGSAVGHLKGILAFDNKSGFWMTHSIPKFGRKTNYEYPENAVTNGQHVFCVSFKVSELEEISKQLLYAHPNIYLQRISNEVQRILDKDSASLFTSKPAFIRSAPLKRKTDLTSAGGQKITSFAKDNQLPEDLYSDIIALGLESPLYAETWQRGAGGPLDPACQTKYTVINIAAINMSVKVQGRNWKNIYFKSTEDHSKWAISRSSSKKWVCMADLNRMESQEKRGGGALCFQSNVVWQEFKNSIYDNDDCSS